MTVKGCVEYIIEARANQSNSAQANTKSKAVQIDRLLEDMRIEAGDYDLMGIEYGESASNRKIKTDSGITWVDHTK